jgi:hypothetical protein
MTGTGASTAASANPRRLSSGGVVIGQVGVGGSGIAVSGGGAGVGAPDGARAVYQRLPSLAGLSVEVGHVPGGGAAAGLPEGSGSAPEVTILRRFSRHESGAAAAEGDAVLTRLLLPALRALVPVMGGPEQVGRGEAKSECGSCLARRFGAPHRCALYNVLQLVGQHWLHCNHDAGQPRA